MRSIFRGKSLENSASRSLAESTFSVEKVLHAKDREAQNFQSSVPIDSF